MGKAAAAASSRAGTAVVCSSGRQGWEGRGWIRHAGLVSEAHPQRWGRRGGAAMRAWTIGSGAGSGTVQRLVRIVESWWRAATWLLVSRGARGEPGDGLLRATVMSLRQARMRSLEEARGMVICVGNHEMVLAMHSVRKSQIQIL
jgi:hypothetical protein